ncbi:MAG: Beta-galactosidase C-terminal domain [Treponema sp.]|nr:Beta-galactosidase C-terminal domain [Treponema sp.]
MRGDGETQWIFIMNFANRKQTVDTGSERVGLGPFEVKIITREKAR